MLDIECLICLHYNKLTYISNHGCKYTLLGCRSQTSTAGSYVNRFRGIQEGAIHSFPWKSDLRAFWVDPHTKRGFPRPGASPQRGFREANPRYGVGVD